MAIIEVEHVTKEFRLGQITSLNQATLNAFKRLRGQRAEKAKPFKALDDVHFSVEEGEVVGIIGHNGAGKSTLLKLLARVSKPTSGRIIVRGRVAPLIEVGAGLVGDFTGRENIYLNGAILGMRKACIDKKFDEIVAFAELEEFIDTPVKRYSSGMSIRLGFSIATSIDADILIVDEVLAVGDLSFQRKCFSRMEDMIKRRKKTVLLVSHNVRQVERLCSRTILLQRGQILFDGKPAEACDLFYQLSNEKVHAHLLLTQQASARIDSSGETEILSVKVIDEFGRQIDQITTGESLRVRVRFELKRPMTKPEFHVGTHTTDFIYLTGSSTALLAHRPDLSAGIHELEYIIPSYPLVPGTYCIRFAILDHHRRVVFHGETLRMFSVAYGAGEARQDELRMLDLPTFWRLDGTSLSVRPESNLPIIA